MPVLGHSFSLQYPIWKEQASAQLPQAKRYNNPLPYLLVERYVLFWWDSCFALVHHLHELDYLILLFDQTFATTCNANTKNRVFIALQLLCRLKEK